MDVVRIIPLSGLPPVVLGRIEAAQREAGRLWSDCVALHVAARKAGSPWPDKAALHRATKGRYALHSQTIQQVAYQVLANVDATRSRRENEPGARRWLRYPYKEKQFFPLYWPAQAVCYEVHARRLVLPMGRGRPSLVFALDLDFAPGAAKLVWRDGAYALHLVCSTPPAAEPPGPHRACIDLGEIHQAAVVTNTGAALVISGRGIRSIKRLHSKQLGEIARKRSRCTRGSRRDRKLAKARQRQSRRAKRRVRDLRHKGTRLAIDFCRAQQVGHLYVGDPRGVRSKDGGRHHNQRMARWEMGKDIGYLQHKSELACIACSTGDERGTSSRCPQCGHRHKPRSREWHCRKCGFRGHRDVVGAANMHMNGFGQQVTFPASVTYRRPGPTRGRRGMNTRARTQPARRSRPDTGLPASAAQLLGVALPTGNLSVPPQALGSPRRRKMQPHAD